MLKDLTSTDGTVLREMTLLPRVASFVVGLRSISMILARMSHREAMMAHLSAVSVHMRYLAVPGAHQDKLAWLVRVMQSRSQIWQAIKTEWLVFTTFVV